MIENSRAGFELGFPCRQCLLLPEFHQRIAPSKLRALLDKQLQRYLRPSKHIGTSSTQRIRLIFDTHSKCHDAAEELSIYQQIVLAYQVSGYRALGKLPSASASLLQRSRQRARRI